MDKEFFKRKISNLTEAKLFELSQLRNYTNKQVIELAAEEAVRRNLEIQFIAPYLTPGVEKTGDKRKLQKWNWGAFLLTPIWTGANKLDKWTIICFIPVANVIAVFYLGFKGNRLAYEKSDIGPVDDFMAVQEHWNMLAGKFFWISIALLLLFALLNI
jgi:hypothetical protein